GDFQYNFNVPNGTYIVNLKFAEIFMSTAGQRVFSVAINGNTVLQNFDIIAQTGAPFTALDKSFPVAVNSGIITIQFTSVVNYAKVSAIEIIQSGTGTVAVSVNPSSASLGASQQQQFAATIT